MSRVKRSDRVEQSIMAQNDVGTQRKKPILKGAGWQSKLNLVIALKNEKALTIQPVCDVTGFNSQYHNKLSLLSSSTCFDTSTKYDMWTFKALVCCKI